MKHKFESYYLDSPLVTGRVFDVFEPEEITKDVAIFIVHGGGWRGGTRTLFHEIMQAFSERGYIIASTDSIPLTADSTMYSPSFVFGVCIPGVSINII